MKNDFLRSVERFIAVADSGSIQGAAKLISISQPSLTHSIAKIEEGFGTRLFERTKRGVVLTRAGQLLYPHAKVILAEGAMASREINDLIEGHIGRFHIRAGASWGYSFMPEIVANLKHVFPELDVQFNIGNTNEAFPQLASGEIDAIIGKYEPEAKSLSGIEHTELTTIPYVLVCSETHPLASKEIVCKSDLSGLPFVAYEPDVQTMKSILAPMNSSDDAGLQIAIYTRSPHVALEMAATGKFAACLSRPFVKKFKSKSLKILETDFRPHEIRTCVYYRQSLTLTNPFKQLMRDLRKASSRIDTG